MRKGGEEDKGGGDKRWKEITEPVRLAIQAPFCFPVVNSNIFITSDWSNVGK